MVITPLPPVVSTQPAPHDGAVALHRARAARGFLTDAMQLATRPGITDPTPALAEALGQAIDAMHEALDAHGHELPTRAHLHLAIDEVRDGLERLHAAEPDARIVALRRARLADQLLAQSMAAIDPHLAVDERDNRPC